MVPGTGSMPRRARYLIPPQLPRRGEVVAAFAVLVLVAHLLLAQLTFLLAIVFTAVSKTTRWRLWWLAVPAAAGLARTLAIGPRAAAAGFTAGPAQILAHLSGAHPLGRLLHPSGAFAGAAGWLPRQFPLALIAAAVEAALAGWLAWVHTDEWAVRPPRPGALAAVRGALAKRATSAGVVVTRDGCVLGVAPASGARVVLGWPEIAGGVLVTGADARTLAVSSLQVAHAALRRRKPLIALDLTGDGALAGVLGAACAATGTPLWAAVEAADGRWLGQPPDETLLARVVRERSAALLSLRTHDVAAQVGAGILAVGEDVRRIGADGDGLVWLYGYEPAPGGPLGGTVASLVAGGATIGLPVLVTTTSPRAVTELAGLVSVLLVHRLADPATADILAARMGTQLVPASWSSREWATAVRPAAVMGQAAAFHPAVAVQPGAATYHGAAMSPAADTLTAAVMPPAAVMPLATAMGHAGFFPPPAAAWPGAVVQPGVVMGPAAAGQPGVAVPPNGATQPLGGIQPAVGMPNAGAVPQAASAALSAAGFVPVPAVPARTLLSLGPAEFVLAVNSPRYRLVKLARAVPARLPRGAMP
ncbi:MAG TPA: hypothetical protein VMC83_07250 [Streptosporangiaceae bacterium]|nr:hypothetical protein [Streptosporangiaceae bacterium]